MSNVSNSLKPFIHSDFMLTNDAAKELYHQSAENLPIIDYHCHLDPKMIADNYQFSDLTEIWLGGDHYKWRAMRASGVEERYITGDAPSYEKFEKWAETLPYTMRNPLYHWTHLELSKIFGIDKILSPNSAKEIYQECTQKLQTPDYRAQNIMNKCNVKVVCTTDDPIDSLEYHKYIQEHPFGVKVLPTWRPDKAMAIENGVGYIEYIKKLSAVSKINITSYQNLLAALQIRHDYFESVGCKLSDHGLDTFYATPYTEGEIETIFSKVMGGGIPTVEEISKFRSAMMYDFAIMDGQSDWTQQFHIGAIRNNNTKMYERVGVDCGYDSINDLSCAEAGNRFFDRVAYSGKLAKSILYCLNPRDNEVLVSMAYNFNDGSVKGKMQFGSGWWFLDQEDGMRKQMNALSSLGLLSHFVGMLTDSRSFLSYPRHDYFRRILCNLLGKDIENGKLPVSEMEFIHQMVKNISYYNAESYFGF